MGRNIGWPRSHRLRDLYWFSRCGRARGGALRQLVEASDIAADAEATIAAESPLAIEHRQARDFDRKQRAIAVDRPADRNPAEGVAGRERARDVPVGIKAERFGYIRPGSS